MTRTMVTITVDTETSLEGALTEPSRYAHQFEGPIDGPVSGRSEGLTSLIDYFTAYCIQTTFFIETPHTCYFGFDKMPDRREHLQRTMSLARN